MQTIWLQRSTADIPWGFRLVGGREFGLPLSVQRVTPGSVAAAALGPGDVILKVGNVMATNLDHNAAQELVRQATNILQLTIKKGEGAPAPQGPLSPGGSGYGSQMSAQLSDNSGYGTTPRSYGPGVPVNINVSRGNETPNYATTPRNYGSQHQPPANSTRIEIQRVQPTQQQSYSNVQPTQQQGYSNVQPTQQQSYNVQPTQQQSYNNNYYNNDTGGQNFPDYTIAYRNQEPIHDSPGGPINVRGYNVQDESHNYSPRSAPRDTGGFSSSDRDGFGGASGPPGYEPRSYNTSQSSFSPREPEQARFSTGVPAQQSYQKPQQSYNTTPQSFQNTYNSTPSQPAYNSTPVQPTYNSTPAQPVYSPAPRQFSPPTSSGPMSPRNQSSSSGYNRREPTTPTGSQYNQAPVYGSSSNEFEQPTNRGPGSNAYSTLPYTKPPYSAPNNTYHTPQYQPPQKAYVPSHASPSPTYEPPAPFSNSQPRSYQSPMSPGSSSGYMHPPAIVRRVSFDQDVHDSGPYTPSSGYGHAHYKSPPPAVNSSSGYYDYGVSTPKSFSRQSSRQEDSSNALPYSPQSGPMSPRSESSGYGYSGSRGGYDPSGVSDALENLNFAPAPSYQPPPAPVAAPPPPPPPGPPPPPAPPLNEWGSTPVKRHNLKSRDEQEEQKVPDQLLNTMLKSAKGGGPKPFSYGIDLSELKKKIGPPTAPKPRPGQPNYEEDEPDVPRQYTGPPRKPAGYVQSDYFIKRDDDSETSGRSHKKPAGLVQSDYYQTRQTGPRSEIDESPININMGTDPKKQSKSFKVLQWMTETDKDDAEEPIHKARRSKDPERRHNAEDDEMRFSGLHSKADIPSKAFSVLQRISSDDGTGTTQNGRSTYDGGEEEADVGNYDETSIRYKGKSIPSPSFRVLQTWAQHDPLPEPRAGVGKDEEEDDDLPDTLITEDMVDKRYKGGNIPSKVFKVLQKSVGEDTPEAPSPVHKGEPAPKAGAPVSDF
ncbi:hypothetical protein BsWGS_20589 [Bradybaena similaris]